MVELSVGHTEETERRHLPRSQTSSAQFEYIFLNFEVRFKHTPQILAEFRKMLEDVIGLVHKS